MTLWKVFLPFCTNSLPSVKRSAVTLKSISFMGCSASFTPPCCTARLPSEREGTTLIVVSSVRISMPSANSAAEISVEGASTVAAPLPNGEVFTGYFRLDTMDKALLAANMQADAVLDAVCHNGQRIQQAWSDDIDEEV